MSVLTYEIDRNVDQFFLDAFFHVARSGNGRTASRNAIGFP